MKYRIGMLLWILSLVCISAYASAPTQQPVTIKILPRRIEQLYNNYCFVCHQAGGAGSPKLGDEQAWNPRIKQGQSLLLKHSLEGINFMPAKGNCQECTPFEMAAIIDYMLAQCPKCDALPSLTRKIPDLYKRERNDLNVTKPN